MTVDELIDKLKEFRGSDKVVVVDCKFEEVYEIENFMFDSTSCHLIVDSEHKKNFKY